MRIQHINYNFSQSHALITIEKVKELCHCFFLNIIIIIIEENGWLSTNYCVGLFAFIGQSLSKRRQGESDIIHNKGLLLFLNREHRNHCVTTALLNDFCVLYHTFKWPYIFNGLAFILFSREDEVTILYVCVPLCVCVFIKSLAKLKVARAYYYHGNSFPH